MFDLQQSAGKISAGGLKSCMDPVIFLNNILNTSLNKKD